MTDESCMCNMDFTIISAMRCMWCRYVCSIDIATTPFRIRTVVERRRWRNFCFVDACQSISQSICLAAVSRKVTSSLSYWLMESVSRT
jgi:hypothetical protein